MEKNTLICTFDKAQYLCGEDVRIDLPPELRGGEAQVMRLERPAPCQVHREGAALVLSGLGEGSYGVCIRHGEAYWEGAFDVVAEHRQVTRYGFLTDFAPDDAGDEDLRRMCALHLNAVQFYDWMYRHDKLLPDSELYSDPMGRPTSLAVIEGKIAACKRLGMRPFAYGAVYAATAAICEAHPDWAMYSMDGKPLIFARWLYFMNIAADSPWSGHIVEQYREAVRFGFEGIHMDTYGLPKHVWDAQGRPVELAEEFPGLITRAAQAVREECPEGGVIFNHVNNWPVTSSAGAPQDAVYIEVWPPNDCYHDLYTLIREAKLLSGDKGVVLAAYLKPFEAGGEPAEHAFRLAWAAISASGGTQLVLGEDRCVLRDSYYVNHARFRDGFFPTVQKYCDFLVRYADLLYDDKGTDISRTASGGINEDICFSAEGCEFSTDGAGGTVWSIIRESRRLISIQLINLRGNDARWNEPKSRPVPAEGIELRLRLDRPVKGIWWASPDADSLRPVELRHSWTNSEHGRIYSSLLPPLDCWAAVWVRLED